jgi:peptidoglycan-associated lipoprotein
LDLEPGVGTVQATGSTSVTPKDSTTYTLTAKGPGGTETATARLSVYAPPTPAPTPRPTVDHSSTVDIFTNNIRDAYFDFDKADIQADAEQGLTGNASFLQQQPDIKFSIEGQYDERGSQEYGLALGDRRANGAKNFLVNAGMSADRMNTISYGKNRPACTDETEQCWQKSRRAHFHYGAESQ